MDFNKYMAGAAFNRRPRAPRDSDDDDASSAASSLGDDDIGNLFAELRLGGRHGAPFGLGNVELRRTALRLLNPDYIVPPKSLPDRTEPMMYLHTTQHNIVAEYAAFLAETSDVYAYMATLSETDEDIFQDDASSDSDSGVRSIAAPVALQLKKIKPCRGRFKPTAPPEEGDPWDLHEHLIITSTKKLGLVRVKEVASAEGLAYRYKVQVGSDWKGNNDRVQEAFDETQRMGTAATPVFLDLGYIGDYIREHAACNQLMSMAVAPLLEAVADPEKRKTVDWFPRGHLDIDEDSPVPINEGQHEALQGLRYQIEAIQGPPGTGKSTAIFHIVKHIMGPREHAVTLASCVQNKAVGAIAEKLAGDVDADKPLVPFIVSGNSKRIGPVAKRYTLDSQVERDPEVERLRVLSEKASTAIDNLLEQMRQAARGAPDELVDELDVTCMRFWLDNDSEWHAVTRPATERQRSTLDGLREELRVAFLETMRLRSELLRAKEAAEERIVAEARVLLCTVAAVGATFRRQSLAPLLHKVELAVLDEAGTTPESKLPLLLLLPRLKAIVAIGDQNQLEPFSHCKHNTSPARGVGRPPVRIRICRDLVNLGACRFGRLGCKFSHDLAAFRAARERNGVCHEFRRTQRCQYGETCVFSHRRGADAGSAWGFLQRLVRVVPVPTLKEQYRMHPKLCATVSELFYEGNLSTPPAVASKRQRQDKTGVWLCPVEDGVEEKPHGRSLENKEEARCALRLYESHAPREDDRRSFLVITFYRAQEALLRRVFEEAGHTESDVPGRGLRIVTVDKSQGSEADVVIVSCVRSNQRGDIGFLSNPNRTNVAISRARCRLLLVGNPHTLSKKPGMWLDILRACKVIESGEELARLAPLPRVLS